MLPSRENQKKPYKRGDFRLPNENSPMDENADAQRQEESPPLVQALAYGRHSEALRLIQQKADVNASCPDGATPLMVAAARDNPVCHGVFDNAKWLLEIADELIKNGANINAQDHFGRTALMYVGLNEPLPKCMSKYYKSRFAYSNVGRGAMTKLLLATEGVNVKLRDRQGKTALDYLIADAVYRGSDHDGAVMLADAMDEMKKYQAYKINLTLENKILDLENRELYLDKDMFGNGKEIKKPAANKIYKTGFFSVFLVKHIAVREVESEASHPEEKKDFANTPKR